MLRATLLYSNMYIEENAFSLKPAQFMADWEGALRLAVKQVYPAADLRGRWFHYCSAIRKKCQKVVKGFHDLKDTNEKAYAIYKQILSIPLLPPEYIEDGYFAIKHKARFDGVFELF